MLFLCSHLQHFMDRNGKLQAIHFNIRLLWNSWGLCQRLCFGICWRWSLTQFCHLTRLEFPRFHTRPGLGWFWVIFPQTRWCAGWRTRRQQPHKLSATGQELGSSMLFSSRIGSSIEKEHHHAMMLMQNGRWCEWFVNKTHEKQCQYLMWKNMSWNQLQILENTRLFWHPIFTLARRSGWMPFWSWEWRRLLGMPVVFRSLSSPQPNRAAKHSIAINCVLPCIAQHIATFASFRRYFEGEILSVLSDEQHVVPPLINLASDWSPESILLLGLHQAARLACWISFLIKYKPPISREATWRLCRITWRFQFFLLKRLFPTGEQFEWYFFRWVETTI